MSRLDQADQQISEAGFPPSARVIIDQDRMQVLYAQGAVEASFALAKDVIASSTTSDGKRIDIVRGLLEAHSSLNRDRTEAAALLARHFAAARASNVMAFLALLPDVAAEVAAAGLAADIEPAFLAEVVSLRNLKAPANAPANWPWPLRVEVLRSFRILTHNEPVAFSGKVQQKPLELLKFLACHREFIAESSIVAAALWPDGEEGAARKSLEVTVSRLRSS